MSARKATQRVVEPPTTLGQEIGDAILAVLVKEKIISPAQTPSVSPYKPTRLTPPGVILTQVQGYAHHFFTSLPFTTTAAAFVDLPARVQEVIVSPTVEALVEYDQAPNPAVNGTPHLIANQAIAAAYTVKRVYVVGASASGILYIWSYW